MPFEHLTRGGTYYRVSDPSWLDPSDTSYSKARGGRWNVADTARARGFGALYLNSTIDVARANARRHVWNTFRVLLEDLFPSKLPDLQEYAVVPSSFVDAVTPAGIHALGLPINYATTVPHPACQAVALRAYDARELGIVPISAVDASAEELVIFDREVAARATKGVRRKAAAWLAI